MSSRKVEPAFPVVLSQSELGRDPLLHSMTGLALPTFEYSFVGIQVAGSADIVRGAGKGLPCFLYTEDEFNPQGIGSS